MKKQSRPFILFLVHIYNSIVDFTCLRFFFSSFFPVKYWHLLTIYTVPKVRHIPTIIWSHIWRSIRSNLMFFVNDDCYVKMNMQSRLWNQLNLCPSLSDTSSNDLCIATSSVIVFIFYSNAYDRIYITRTLQNNTKILVRILLNWRLVSIVLTVGGYVNSWLIWIPLRVDATVVVVVERPHRNISRTEFIHCRRGRGDRCTNPLFLILITCE